MWSLIASGAAGTPSMRRTELTLAVVVATMGGDAAGLGRESTSHQGGVPTDICVPDVGCMKLQVPRQRATGALVGR